MDDFDPATFDPVAFQKVLDQQRKVLDEKRALLESLSEEPTTLVDDVQSFRQKHPFVAGLIEGAILVKIKHLLQR